MGSNNILIRPGTVFIILMAAAVGVAVVQWSSQTLEATKNSSNQNRRSSLDCSTLSVDFSGLEVNSTHSSVVVGTDQNVEAIAVTFRGETNETKIIVEPSPGSLNRVTTEVEDPVKIFANVKGCSRKFRY